MWMNLSKAQSLQNEDLNLKVEDNNLIKLRPDMIFVDG